MNSVPFLAVLTVIVGHSLFKHSFYGKNYFSVSETFNNNKMSKNRENPFPVQLMFKGRKKVIFL